ncbi:zinc finger BED domain-containing protein RICESLEEPER 2-like [Humulus lupulus]|uniref:zinc finger BED domain-containing protein RICESLEEPER 2-like n=1 Tax=Humulus lupulus TaxID=3486 RepID=UPI002B407551|nr:zinc finger BED domain-containing protein RICESLEEPER 2-like [Humulus lupulus]
MSVEDLIRRLHIEGDNKSAEKQSSNPNVAKANTVEHDKGSKGKKPKPKPGSKLGPKGGVSKKSKFQGKFFNYNKTGHKSSDCRLLKKKGNEANVVEAMFQEVADLDLCVMLSEINLVDVNPKEWWLDTGATHHVCANKSAFSDLTLVENGEKIYMGNSTTSEIKGQDQKKELKSILKRIINFIQVPSHKGDLVGKELINCLSEWGISLVFAVTVDNASSNDVALRKLKGHLLDKDNTIPLNGEMFHMRCSTHILNLIVTDGLKELNDAISSIRNAVRYVRSSPARLKRFKESCKDANIESKALLCLDVVTRWNSTYLMLESAIKFKKAFENLEADANYTKYFDEERMDGPPTNLDWEKAVVFVDFWRRFYDLTN